MQNDLPASLGEAETSVGFATSMEEVAASVLGGWDSGMVVVLSSIMSSSKAMADRSSISMSSSRR